MAAFRRRRGGDEGFTLIELMVVVLIIAILIAIAIPTFLGARKRAQRKQAQTSLRNVLTHEKTYYTDNQTYTTDATTLKAIDPAFSYVSGAASTDPRTVAVAVDPTLQSVGMGSWSKSGDCYYILDTATGTPTFGKLESGTVAQSSGCTPGIAADMSDFAPAPASSGATW